MLSMNLRCPSAKMVSNAKDDLPEPETPVITVSSLWLIVKSMFFKLWTLAPFISIFVFTGAKVRVEDKI